MPWRTVSGPACEEPDAFSRRNREDAPSMKALSWILYCLVAFGVGTGVAFAVHPPTSGIPATTASGLAQDLSAIQQFASEGRCDAVEGHIDSAQAKIRSLPSDTTPGLVTDLRSSLKQVSATARTSCDTVAAAEREKTRKEREAQQAAEAAARATTPTTPVTPTEPTTPDPGGDEGGPDPGTGEDPGTVTTPETPGTTDPSGGVTPDIEGVQQELQRKLEKERQKWEHRLRKIQEQWGQ